MPVARIITAAREHLEDLSSELRQAGYTVEFAAPGDTAADADLVINAELVDAEDAAAVAGRAANEMAADVVVSPGCIPADSTREQRRERELAEQQRLATEAREREERERHEAEQRGRERELAQQQRLATEARAREERERREAEQRRREQELAEQQRVATEARAREERERHEAEQRRRERELAEQQRVATEARAREERERQAREAERQLAIEAAERERREAERIRAERERAARQREQALVRTLQVTTASDAEPAFAAARIAELRNEPSLGPRRMYSPRQRRLQRATLIASIVALIVMLGFAASLRFHAESPLPHNVVQNPAQQEVPFGPAHITPKPPAAAATPAPPQKKASPGRVNRKRGSRSAAEDEVTVRKLGPARRQTAQSQSSDGVRRYSDQ